MSTCVPTGLNIHDMAREARGVTEAEAEAETETEGCVESIDKDGNTVTYQVDDSFSHSLVLRSFKDLLQGIDESHHGLISEGGGGGGGGGETGEITPNNSSIPSSLQSKLSAVLAALERGE